VMVYTLFLWQYRFPFIRSAPRYSVRFLGATLYIYVRRADRLSGTGRVPEQTIARVYSHPVTLTSVVKSRFIEKSRHRSWQQSNSGGSFRCSNSGRSWQLL
jgi:hypothetical protein